jgi:RNA polymerase sigma-70 factor (ECF subfamily)
MDEQPAEAELIALAKVDRRAFGLLYDLYAAQVYRFCYRRLGNREGAEDATADVFAKALAALPSCRETSFRPWLFRIAHNVVIDGFRAARSAASLVAAEGIADTTPLPEEAAIAADHEREIAAALAQLTVDQRAVVEFRRAGMTCPEIANVLGWGLSRVKVTQFRAYGRLRTLLATEGHREEMHGGRR